MKVFSGKQKCKRCGKEYDWFGYKLESENRAVVGIPMPHHFGDAFKDGAGQWHVITYCDCGYKEETENFAIG